MTAEAPIIAAQQAETKVAAVTPPVTTPPVVAPPVAEPPVSTPPVTTPPVTAPPVTTPPVATPPASSHRATPPASEPPTSVPPAARATDSVPPVAATPSRTARPANARYSVQLAAYHRRDQAQALVRRLAAVRIEARVDGTAAPFRVRTGYFTTRAAAAARLAETQGQQDRTASWRSCTP